MLQYFTLRLNFCNEFTGEIINSHFYVHGAEIFIFILKSVLNIYLFIFFNLTLYFSGPARGFTYVK